MSKQKKASFWSRQWDWVGMAADILRQKGQIQMADEILRQRNEIKDKVCMVVPQEGVQKWAAEHLVMIHLVTDVQDILRASDDPVLRAFAETFERKIPVA